MRVSVAAAVGLAILFFFLLDERRPSSFPKAVASVELAKGAIVSRVGGGDPVPVLSGGIIDGGVTVETGPDASRVAIRMSGGVAIRLDQATRATLMSSSEIRLDAGALYVDTGTPADTAGGIVVRTPSGVARDIGTQFEVRVPAGTGTTIVRVREGRVVLDSHGLRREAASGTELVVEAADRVFVRPLPGWSREWEWVLDAAPVFSIEGRTLEAYLDWVARETGWSVTYATPWVRARAAEIVLHGSIENTRPDEAPFAVLAGSGLSGTLVDGNLVVGETRR